MTREEAVEELKILKEDYWDDDGYGHETKQYDDTELALDMAIQALEQEPILDKAIKEIVAKSYNEQATYPECIDGSWCENIQIVNLDDVLNILDKYKTESEGEK